MNKWDYLFHVYYKAKDKNFDYHFYSKLKQFELQFYY